MAKKIGYGIFSTDFTKIGYDFGYDTPPILLSLPPCHHLKKNSMVGNFFQQHPRYAP